MTTKIMDNFDFGDVSDVDRAVEKLISEYDDTTMTLPDMESEPHLLISKVRKHYMTYVVKMISINYETNQKLLNKNIYLPSAIWRCAKSMEMSAALACMTVSLYRKKIVAEIKELKEDTNRGKLNRKLFSFLKNPPENEKKTQTSGFKYQECNCQCTCGRRKKRRTVSISPDAIQDNICDIPKNEIESENNTLYNILSDTEQNNKDMPFTQAVTSNASNVKVDGPNEVENPDEIMLQLEKLFQGDTDEDIFEDTLCDVNFSAFDQSVKMSQTSDTKSPKENNVIQQSRTQDIIIESHTEQIKMLDERLASLAGILGNNDVKTKQQLNAKVKKQPSKWLCEEYFLKSRLFELLDRIGDVNRKKLERIKAKFLELFGPDSDDEGVMSPLEETPEFIISCKERIAPWVVKLLTPYYVHGRIKGKVLFKALAKHLIRLIYQCSRYPEEYEVHSFVKDFLQNHKMIRCEADFKQFRIENI